MGNHIWSLFAPVHMKSWPNVKSSQLEVSLILLKITHLASWKSLSGHYFPQFIWKVYQSWNQVKLESVRTLRKITRPVHRKSFPVNTCPNSHEKLTKGEIMSSWCRFEHCSEPLPIGSHIWSLFSPIHMKSWPKVKLGQFEHCSESLI